MRETENLRKKRRGRSNIDKQVSERERPTKKKTREKEKMRGDIIKRGKEHF